MLLKLGQRYLKTDYQNLKKCFIVVEFKIAKYLIAITINT